MSPPIIPPSHTPSHLLLLSLLLLIHSSLSTPSSHQPHHQPTLNIHQQQYTQHNHSWDNITNPQAYQLLNQQIQSLQPQFIHSFLSYFHLQKSRLLSILNDQAMAPDLKLSNIRHNPGNYLLLLAKMYLYNLLPKSQLTGFTWPMYSTDSTYILAYYYLKIAAQRYENPQAYYYLAVLDYYKINPHQTVIKNLEKQYQRIAQQQGYDKAQETHYLQLLDYLRNQRFISVEQNLFMSSMIGHHGASLALASMYKEGVGLQKNYKNCTTALSYYLSVIRDTYVDQYEFRSAYSDEKNFEKELYSKRKVVFESEQNVDVVSETEFFDSETIKAMYELADNYFIGKNGFKRNYVKAAELFAKLASQDHKNSMSMLGMCYFKGQGVPLDRKRARLLFQQSSTLSISQAMLLVMDYFEIESQGKRVSAITKMKEIYDKKKDSMNTILKYLFAGIIIKGDVPTLKADDAILLMGSAAKEGHLMAKISMGLLFADGIDVNYDCARAIDYFYEESSSHPFFIDKFYAARFGLKSELFTFSLIKYLELSIIGDINSFINALYILETQNQNSLGMNLNSWNIKTAAQNELYQILKKQKIVPDIESFFQKQYSFYGKKPMKFSTLYKLLEGNKQVLEEHINYMKKKIIKVCAVTKDNSLMHFYDYKMTQKQEINRLNTIANGSPSKLHVLQSRYLLGQLYHKRSFKAKEEGKDFTKDQYNALQEYKRATSSPILGKILFYFEEMMLNPQGIDFEDQMFDFGFVNDFLTFTFVLSIVVFVLYYKRSKKLDEIHRKELEKRSAEIKAIQRQAPVTNPQSPFINDNNPTPQSGSQQIFSKQLSQQVQINHSNQPQIQEQRQPLGYRIGSSLEQDDHLVLREYEEYKIEENPSSQSNDTQTDPFIPEQPSNKQKEE